MEIDLTGIPQCFIHKKQITHICSCGACKIPNPMICSDPQCMKPHSHPMQQIISIAKLAQLLQRNTSSMKMLIKRAKQYYKEVRESICHEIQKVEDMMGKALQYKHTHPVINLFKHQKYNEISPQKMVQLISYLRGAKTQRKTMQFIKNELYTQLQKLETLKKSLFQSPPFTSLILLPQIDLNPTFSLTLANISTSTLDSEQQFKTILKMIHNRTKKQPTNMHLLYRASEHEYSAGGYLLNMEGRGPFLMVFKTENGRKFGAYLHVKVEGNGEGKGKGMVKDGWITDGPGFSFIFSLDHDSILAIKQEAKCRVKALYLGEKGPQIGAGCDIYISNQCNSNQQSGSNLGGSFELPSKLVYGSKEAKQYLAGQQNFTVVQYEVYEAK